jgi:UDP-GlcNAc:undecaprenyl-phosphate/decaprenyl-phosphate GlcNAc-1-phosphate transferase
MIYLSTTLTSIFITISLVPVFKKLALRCHLVDVPNGRKVHCAPMPKTGGIAMAMGLLVPILCWAPGGGFVRALMAGAGVLVVFGLADDIKELGYRTKLVGQLIAAMALVYGGDLSLARLGDLLPDGVVLPHWMGHALTVFVIVGVTNAINLSDGLDGLAGGISLMSFLCIGLLGYQCEMVTVAVTALAVAGAIFGFLRYNSHPATVFMGDAGSQLLGFLAAGLSIRLCQGPNPLSPSLPLIILGFPILDTATVMIERMSKGKSPFVADKNHFHHKLMRLGLYHSEAVLAIYFLQSALITFAFFIRFYSDWLIVLCYLGFSGSIVCLFQIADRTGWRFKREGPFDRIVKKRLKRFRDSGLHIAVPFGLLHWCLPLFVLFICLIPAAPHWLIRSLYLAWAGAMLAGWHLWGQEGKELGARIFQFFLMPVALFQAEFFRPDWLAGTWLRMYHLSFVLIALLVVHILKTTRRRKGFHVSTMDYLIVFIAIVVPLLPMNKMRDTLVINILPQIIVLFFAFEVLLGELRGNYSRSCLLCMGCMLAGGAWGIVRVFI